MVVLVSPKVEYCTLVKSKKAWTLSEACGDGPRAPAFLSDSLSIALLVYRFPIVSHEVAMTQRRSTLPLQQLQETSPVFSEADVLNDARHKRRDWAHCRRSFGESSTNGNVSDLNLACCY